MELIHRFLISSVLGLLSLVIFVTCGFLFFHEKVVRPKEQETAMMILNLAKQKVSKTNKWDEQQFLSILQPFANKFLYVHFISESQIYPALDNTEGFDETYIKNIYVKNLKNKTLNFYFTTGFWPIKNKVYGSLLPESNLQIIVVEKAKYLQIWLLWFILLVSGLVLFTVFILGLSYAYFKPLLETFENSFEKLLPPEKEVKAYFSLAGLNELMHSNVVNRSLSFDPKKAKEFDELKKEIALAESIQANLFPDHIVNSGDLSIVSVFGTATHCSGDWWFHKKVGDSDYIILADATGHGMPAALMTSAATAIVNTMDWSEDLSVNDLLLKLNQGIYNVGKAKINMTAVSYKFDWKNKKITVSSASHEFPYWYKRKANSIEAMVVDRNCPRLGESEKSKYYSTEYPLEEGDIFILYTDGIIELFEAHEKRFSERQLLKKLRESCERNNSAVDISNDFKEILKNSAGLSALPDDITYIVCKTGSV